MLIVQDFLDLRIRLLISFENNNFFFKILGSTGGIVNPNIFGIHVTRFSSTYFILKKQ